MSRRKMLFFSGSLGLGHIGRDLEIANALREKNPEIDISWLAEDPASKVLAEAGEYLLPEAKLLISSNAMLNSSARLYKANLVKWVMEMRKGWSANAKLLAKLIKRGHFDLVIGDETYEIIVEMVSDSTFKTFPFIMIYDFIGVDSVTRNPIDQFGTYMVNRLWVKGLRNRFADRSLFIGEIEDVPNRKFGFMLPNRRQIALKYVDFVGYVLTFNPNEYKNKTQVRRLLGYSENPLIVCSIGGTSAGKDLLDLCAKAYPIMKKELPDLQMVLVCGPQLQPDSIQT